MQEVKSSYKTERGTSSGASGIRAKFEKLAQDEEEVSDVKTSV